jgi:hypothetical protein
VANPRRKPLHTFNVERFTGEPKLVVLAPFYEPFDRIINPCVNAFLFDVHVDVEGSAFGGFERQ